MFVVHNKLLPHELSLKPLPRRATVNRHGLSIASLSGLLLLMLAWSPPAYGYVDPGAGSLILQLLLGGLAGLFVFGRLFKQKLLRFFRLSRDEEEK